MICKAMKMMVLTGAVLGGSGLLLFGTDLGSYLGTMASSVRESVVGQIPVPFQLKRAEGLIRQIDPQIDTCKRDLANAEVELENLQASVTRLERVVDNEEKKLKTGAQLLSGDGTGEVRLAADHLSRRRVEVDLQRTLDSFKNNSAMLKAKRTLIDRQSQAVQVAKQRLVAVSAERETLCEQVRSLKVQQQQIEAMAASSRRFDLDSSALSQAKAVVEEVRKRLDVAQKMIENEMVFQGEDVVSAADASRDVLKEIHEQFGHAAVLSVGTQSVGR